jgi:hypothetical protein
MGYADIDKTDTVHKLKTSTPSDEELKKTGQHNVQSLQPGSYEQPSSVPRGIMVTLEQPLLVGETGAISETEDVLHVEASPSDSGYSFLDATTVSVLYKLSKRDGYGKYEVDEGELESLKEALKERLNIPEHFELHIFSDKKGSAVSVNSRGEALVEGHFTLFSQNGRGTQIGFVFNNTLRELFIDGKQISRVNVPLFLANLKRSIEEPAALHEILGRVQTRAQTIFFKGIIPRNTKDIHVIVTHNYIEPFDFHVYVGTESKMTPLALISDSGIRNNLGTFLRGKLPSEEVVVIFIPFRRDDGLHIAPSMNGIAIAQEAVKQSSAVHLSRVTTSVTK